MILVYKCHNCGSCFTVSEKAVEEISKLFGLDARLHDLGYCNNLHIPSGWEVVREKAKCCDHPRLGLERYE